MNKLRNPSMFLPFFTKGRANLIGDGDQSPSSRVAKGAAPRRREVNHKPGCSNQSAQPAAQAPGRARTDASLINTTIATAERLIGLAGCSSLLIAASLGSSLITVERAEAHGAWLGSCQVDFSGATVAQIQANVNAGKSGIVDGDFVEYVAACPVIVSGTLSGPGGYVTFYKPNSTEVVGVWIVNSAEAAINARPATSAVSNEGISRGWGPRGQHTNFDITANGWNPSSTAACTSAGYTRANCNSGLAFIYGDTGIFYSTRADTAIYTGGAARIAVTNGYQTNPTNATPWGTVGGSGNERVHNKWDAVQTNAFGSSSPLAGINGFSTLEDTALADGRASTPFNAGSPVAGPDSGSVWDRYGTTGPWNRISYPGSCFANDPAIAGTEGPANGAGSVVPQAAGGAVNSISACTTTTAGASISDVAPLPGGTNAVRFALGGITNGETHRVKVRLKVNSATSMGPANFDSHGGDSTQGAAAGNDNPWRYWIGAPSVSATGSARLFVNKDIVSVNGAAYNGSTVPPGAKIRYRISYASAFSGDQTNVVLSDVLPSQATGTSNYSVVSGPNIVPASLPSSGTFNFQTIATLGPGMGGVIEFDVTTNAVVGNTVTNTARINSTQVPTLQTDTVSTTVVALATLSATNDSATGINGLAGAAAVVNAFTADTVNGAAASSANAILSVASGSSVPTGLSFNTATGNVDVAADTAAGTYTFNYSLCEKAFPTNCKTATISVTVIAAPIAADADSVAGINGANGASDVLDVIPGDTLNGAQVTLAQVNLSVTTPATPANPGAPVPALDTATGKVSVPAGTPAGTYTITYQICEKLNPTNCATNTATVTVNPSIDLSITKSNGVSQVTSGSTITYTLVVTNNGPDAATGAVVSDTPGTGLTCPVTNPVTLTGPGAPAGSYTIADLVGSGITLGTLGNGQSVTITYSCVVN